MKTIPVQPQSTNSDQPDPNITYIDYQGLSRYGIVYNRNWLNQLINKGKFPRPIHLSRNKRVWKLAVIFQWLKDKEETVVDYSRPKAPPNTTKTRAKL